MSNLGQLIEKHGVDVFDYLDREALVPVLAGPQAQGDVIVVPGDATPITAEKNLVPKEGIAVVISEVGGNTHRLLADGKVFWEQNNGTDIRLGTVTIPEGSTAVLAHPEHGYLGIAPGTFEIRRQREQSDVIRMVQD